MYIHPWSCLLVGAFIVCRAKADVSLNLIFVGDPVSAIYIGEIRTLRVVATFDANKSYSGVRIELLPSTSQLVFALSEVISATTTGCTTISNPHTKNDILTRMFSDASYDPNKDIVAYQSRAELDLGNVTAGSLSCTYTIDYEIVHVSRGNYSSGSQYWTSVGMEYTEATFNYIWVSQVDSNLYDVKSGAPSLQTVEIPATPVPEVELSTLHTATLQLSVEYPRATIKIETSLKNGTTPGFYVTGLNVKAVGSAFAYALAQGKAVTDSTCPLSTNITLNIGTIVNRESQKTAPIANASKIDIEISLQADSRAVLGSNYVVQTIVTLGGTPTTKEFAVKVVQNKNATSFTTFTIGLKDGIGIISKGNIGLALVKLEVPSQSSHLYNLTMTTSPVNPTQKALSILAVSPVWQGNDIQCSLDDVTEFIATEDAGNQDLFSQATFYMNVTNMNFNKSISVNSELDLNVAFMVLNDSSVNNNDNHKFEVNVNGLTPKSVVYTVSAPVPYATNLAYSYTVKPVCGSDPVFHPGSVAYFDLEITTERNKTAGPMTIEAPIPDNLTEPVLTFVNAKVVKKGKNVLCTALGKVRTKLSDWVSGSNESDRGVMNLPLVCNLQVVGSVDEDKFTLRIGVRIKDLPVVLDGNMTQVNFSLGLTISDQIWVYTTTANVINKMKTPVSPAFVKGIDLLASTVPATWPTGFDLEWSPDNRKFYPSKNAWLQQSASTWNLDVGLIGYWFRLVSKDEGCMPANYQLTSVPLTQHGYHSYGPADKQDNLFKKLQLAVDNDDSTCLAIPAANSTDTVPYLWLTLEPKAIGLPNQNSSFNLTLIGKGFGCYGKNGDQVTKVSHPMSGNNDIYEGRRPLCKIIYELPFGTQYRCVYKCDCHDVSSCNDVNIFMRHSLAQNSNDYNLCSIRAN